MERAWRGCLLPACWKSGGLNAVCPAPLWLPQGPFPSAGMSGGQACSLHFWAKVSLEGKTKPRGGRSPAPPRPWPLGSRPPIGGEGYRGASEGGGRDSRIRLALFFKFRRCIFKFNYNVFVSVILFLHVYIFVLSPLSKWLPYGDITALMGTGPYIASSFGLQHACKASGPAYPITRRGCFPQSGGPRALPLRLLLGCWGAFMLQSCLFLSGGVLENSESWQLFISFSLQSEI